VIFMMTSPEGRMTSPEGWRELESASSNDVIRPDPNPR
jgi:hypothetical protein